MNWVCKFCSTANPKENEECFVCGRKYDEDLVEKKNNWFTKVINKLKKRLQMLGLFPRG